MIFMPFFGLALISNSVKEGILKAFKNEAATKYEKVFVKLHTGDPGSEGKNNAAGEATRKEVAFTGTTTLKNSGALKWTGVSTKETIKYVSFWTAASEGTFLANTITEAEKALEAGDNLEIAAEGLSWTVA